MMDQQRILMTLMGPCLRISWQTFQQIRLDLWILLIQHGKPKVSSDNFPRESSCLLLSLKSLDSMSLVMSTIQTDALMALYLIAKYICGFMAVVCRSIQYGSGPLRCLIISDSLSMLPLTILSWFSLKPEVSFSVQVHALISVVTLQSKQTNI